VWWCSLCVKQVTKPFTCEKYTIIVFDICREGLLLLQQYDECLEEYTNTPFGVEAHL
jgi:hypothetical protein